MSVKHYLFYIAQNYSFAILRPIQKIILARGDKVVWFLKGSEVDADYLTADEKRLHTINEVKQYNPCAVFVPGNVVPSFIPGLKVAVFHGFNVEKRSNTRGHFNIRGCFDLYCTQGPNTTSTFLSLAEKYQYFSVKETGWSAIDPLYIQENIQENTQNNIQENIQKSTQAEKTTRKKTILMCSTFSKQLSCAPVLFEKIKQLSATGRWHWLVQFHPKMAKETVEQYKSLQSEYLSFIETDNVIPLLQQADVMVCDTSSVLSMFLLLNKPVVTFKNSSPKSHMFDIDDVERLEQSIEQALSRPKSLMSEVEKFIEQTHPFRDGQSSQRVLDAVDEILAGKNLSVKSKPLNFIRMFKMRKELNYWKFW